MVAGSHRVESGCVQKRNQIFALADCDHRHTVESVARVKPKRRGIFRFDGFNRRSKFRKTDTFPAVVCSLNARMHVVCVEDN